MSKVCMCTHEKSSFLFCSFFLQNIFDLLGFDDVLEIQTFEALVKSNHLAAFKHKGFWMGMDTYKEYLILKELWESGDAPWRLWD